MLVARNKAGRLINLLDDLPEKDDFFCPACGAEVRLKRGTVKRPHFAHINLQDCHFYSENESAEHLSLKSALYTSLSKTERVVVEQFLPKLGQIADLLVNERLVLEVQCSRLSEDRLRERTQAYQKSGFQVLWLLGKKLWLGKQLTPLQHDFLYFSKNMGFHLWELDLSKECLRLKYLIHEDGHNRVHFLVKECRFSGHLFEFLHQPFVKQLMETYRLKMDEHLLSYIQRQLIAKNPRWLKKQEEAYYLGENLLSKSVDDFYPQVRPPQGSFCQIERDLSKFYQQFEAFYRSSSDKRFQRLYPPAFYDKINAKGL
ncbi:competence protein CoiA [Streptococcus dentasini]